MCFLPSRSIFSIIFFLTMQRPTSSTLFPYTTLFRSHSPPIPQRALRLLQGMPQGGGVRAREWRSEEHTSELQSPDHLVCRLLLEKKKPYEWSYSLVSGRPDGSGAATRRPRAALITPR